MMMMMMMMMMVMDMMTMMMMMIHLFRHAPAAQADTVGERDRTVKAQERRDDHAYDNE